MKTISARVVSSKPVSLSTAAEILSSFASVENGASQAVSVYLRRASDAFRNLVQFHTTPYSDRKHRKRKGTNDHFNNEEDPVQIELSSVGLEEKNRVLEVQDKGRVEIDGVEGNRKIKKKGKVKAEVEPGVEVQDKGRVEIGVEGNRKVKNKGKVGVEESPEIKEDQHGRKMNSSDSNFDRGGHRESKNQNVEIGNSVVKNDQKSVEGLEDGNRKRRDTKKRKKESDREERKGGESSRVEEESRKKRKLEEDEGVEGAGLSAQSSKKKRKTKKAEEDDKC